MADTKPASQSPQFLKMQNADGKEIIVSPASRFDWAAKGYRTTSEPGTEGGEGPGALELAGNAGEAYFNQVNPLGVGGGASDVVSGAAGALAAPDVPRAAGPGIDAPLADTNAFTDAVSEAHGRRMGRRDTLGAAALPIEMAGALTGAALFRKAPAGAGAIQNVAGATPTALMNEVGTKIATKLLATEAAKAAVQSKLGSMAVTGAARAVGLGIESALQSGVASTGERLPQIVENPLEAAKDIAVDSAWGGGLGAGVGGALGTVEGLFRAKAGPGGQSAVDQLINEVAEPNYVPATKALTSEDAVAANATRPLRAQDLPAPERTLAADLMHKHTALAGGKDEAAQKLTTLIHDEGKGFLADARGFEEQADIATKRLFNEPRIVDHLNGQMTDIIDPDDAARIAGIEGAVTEARTRLDTAGTQLADLGARRTAALQAQTEARSALDALETPAIRQTQRLNPETGQIELVDKLRPAKPHETKDLRAALKAANEEVKATDALFKAANEESDAASQAFGVASKARGGTPIDTSDVVRGTQFDQPTFSIGDKGNEMATARARLDMDPELLAVDTIDTREAVRGKGLGTKLYAAMAEDAESQGRKLASDVTANRSPNAESWWKKRVAEGKAEFNPAKDRYILTGKLEAPGAITPRKMTATEHEGRAMFSEMRKQNEVFGKTEVFGKEAEAVKQLDLQVAKHEQGFKDAIKAGDFGRAHNIIDQNLKHAIRDFAKSTKSKTASDYAKGLYKIPQAVAESASMWGDEVAGAQRLANPNWSASIAAQEAADYKGFFSRGGEVAEDWIPDNEVNSAAVKALVGSIGDAGAISKQEALRKGLRAQVADANTRAKAWGTPEAQAYADRMAQRATRIEDALDIAEQVNKDAEGMKKLITTGQFLAGAAALGTAGVNASSMDFENATQLGVAAIATRWLLGAAGKYRGNGIQRAIQGAVKLVRGTGKVAERGTMQAARAAGSARGREAAMKRTDAMLKPESKEFLEIVKRAEMVNRASPGLGDAILKHQIEEAEYVKQYLPKPPSTAQFTPPAKNSRAASMQLERVLAAVSDPPLTFGRITDGMATKQDLDAMRQLYPTQYQRMVDEIMVQLDAAPAQRRSRSTEMYLSAVVGQPLTPALVGIMENQKRAQAATYNAAQEGKPKGEGKNGADGKTARPDINMDMGVYSSRGDSILAGG